jgi:hypothetical protein
MGSASVGHTLQTRRYLSNKDKVVGMPWSVGDVDRFKKGLSPSDKKKWVKIANTALQQCLDKGNTEAHCAAMAIRVANSMTGK